MIFEHMDSASNVALANLLARPSVALSFDKEVFDLFMVSFEIAPAPWPVTPASLLDSMVYADDTSRARDVALWSAPELTPLLREAMFGKYIDWYSVRAVLLPSDQDIECVNNAVWTVYDRAGTPDDVVEAMARVADRLGWCGQQDVEGYHWWLVFAESLRERVDVFCHAANAINAEVRRVCWKGERANIEGEGKGEER